MNLNPKTMMQAKKAMEQFSANHPRFVAFFEAQTRNGLPEGSIVEITVTRPGQEPVTTNMRVQPSDVELFKELKELQ